MAQGHVAAIAGNGWEVGAVTAPKTGNPKLASKLSTFPFPGTAAGKYTPSFLGGSDLAVPAKAPNAALGAEWIKIFTDTTSQTQLAKFAIPNTTSAAERVREAVAGQPVDRRGREEHLVRAEHAELGERRERQRAAEHAGVDRDRQVERSPRRQRPPTSRSRRSSTARNWTAAGASGDRDQRSTQEIRDDRDR